MGIADAVFPIVFKHLAMTAVNARGKIKFFKFPTECPVFIAIPNFCHTGLHDIAEKVMVNGPADIAQVGVAIVQQRHAGTHIAIATDKGHAFLDELAVRCLADDGLVIEA